MAEPNSCQENVRSYKTAHVPILAAEDGHFADCHDIDYHFQPENRKPIPLNRPQKPLHTAHRHLNRALLLHLCDIIST